MADVTTGATDLALLEDLRVLSEAATPGEWFQGYGSDDELWNGDSQSRHKIWPDQLGVGRLIARTGTDFTGWMPQDDANAAFIVAAVNHVRVMIQATLNEKEAG